MHSNEDAPTAPARDGSIATPKDEKRADAQPNGVEQDGSPDRFRADVLKERGVTGFMVQISSRLRKIQPSERRAEARCLFFKLLKGLCLDVNAQPPYNLAAADRLRGFLEETGLGEEPLLDFEMILGRAEKEAQKRKDMAEQLVEVMGRESKRKGEWEVIEGSDVDEQWEMI